jgi:hypothetical protein
MSSDYENKENSFPLLFESSNDPKELAISKLVEPDRISNLF